MHGPALARLAREAQVATRVHHPNVVAIIIAIAIAIAIAIVDAGVA